MTIEVLLALMVFGIGLAVGNKWHANTSRKRLARPHTSEQALSQPGAVNAATPAALADADAFSPQLGNLQTALTRPRRVTGDAYASARRFGILR